MRERCRSSATTSSSSAAARPGSPSGTSWPGTAAASRSSRPPASRLPRGATRWDSLKLFTPVRYDSLPGLPFPGDPDAYPGRDDVVAYLTRYAEHFDLPVELDSEVLAVRPGDAALRGRAARPYLQRRPGGRRHGRVPDAADPAPRRGARRCGRPDAQHRVPLAARRARRPRAGRGRRQHRLSDRRRARRLARGAPRRRLAPGAAAPAAARPRHLPLPRGGAPHARDGRLAARAAAAAARDAHRAPARASHAGATASNCGRGPWTRRGARSASPTARRFRRLR